MTLEYFRTKRSLIMQVIDSKHADWLRLATDGEDAAADVCAKTIEKLYADLAKNEHDIIRVKEELIQGAL